jgi:hypothetical protein
MLVEGEFERINKSRSDISGMTGFLKRYMLGEEYTPSSVKELSSVMDIPIFKKKTEFEDITRHMQTTGARLFGVDKDFVKLKLPFEVSGFGKGNEKVSELLLPNVYMSHVGENIYASTNYQKALKHLMSTA